MYRNKAITSIFTESGGGARRMKRLPVFKLVAKTTEQNGKVKNNRAQTQFT